MLKLIFPLFVATEPLFDYVEHFASRLWITTEVREVQLMQNY